MIDTPASPAPLKTSSSNPPTATWWPLVKKAAAAWVADYAPSMGAALSYYSVFSLAPLLLIVISIAGLVFGQDAVRGELFGQLRGLLGADGATAVEGLLASVSKPGEGILSTIIGIVVLLVGATTVFGELQDALDRIWRAPPRDRSGGVWGLIRARLLSFGMILGIAFLLMVSLVMSAVVAALGKWWSGAFGGWELLAQTVNLGLGFALTTAVFAMIYKIIPRVSVKWHDVWLGAAVTSLLFTVGRFLIGLYIGKSGVASGFGAAGSLIVIFVWVYYSAQIFLIGAEFTWVYATTFGSMRDVVGTPSVADVGDAVDLAQAKTTEAIPSAHGAVVAAGETTGQSDLGSPRVVRTHQTDASHPSLAGFGLGLAAGVVTHAMLPRLARIVATKVMGSSIHPAKPPAHLGRPASRP